MSNIAEMLKGQPDDKRDEDLSDSADLCIIVPEAGDCPKGPDNNYRPKKKLTQAETDALYKKQEEFAKDGMGYVPPNWIA